MALAILLAIVSPDVGFLALFGTAVAGMLFIWIVILVTYLRFRASLSPERVSALPIRLPAHRMAAVFGIVMLIAIAATTFFVEGLRYTVPSFLPFLIVISFFYVRTRRHALAESRKPGSDSHAFGGNATEFGITSIPEQVGDEAKLDRQ
jgi:L-asparagine transporter-like permease